uniref:Uncharacterized protein n=1 Tax=Rhizophora mucronata TaxID=61149 RepID=A0A2P2IJ26_RHIMU
MSHVYYLVQQTLGGGHQMECLWNKIHQLQEMYPIYLSKCHCCCRLHCHFAT